VCQDWANTKAAYRFFSNERVDEDAILSGHFQATRDRTAKIGGAGSDSPRHDGIYL
jgi:Transposase DNA-binding